MNIRSIINIILIDGLRLKRPKIKKRSVFNINQKTEKSRHTFSEKEEIPEHERGFTETLGSLRNESRFD